MFNYKNVFSYFGIAIAASVLFVAPAAADLLPGVPQPVIDVGPEQTTWAGQLFQQIETQVNTAATQIEEYQQLRLQIQNAIPTTFGWPLAGRGISVIEPVLQIAEQQLNANRGTVQAQTGVAMPPDAATTAAEDGMNQLAGEQNDLDTAQAASDDAPGDLAAQQAGQRISALQASDGQKLRQFLYAQQLQKSSDEADAETWSTMPIGNEGFNT